jgi:hypothetical protein
LPLVSVATIKVSSPWFVVGSKVVVDHFADIVDDRVPNDSFSSLHILINLLNAGSSVSCPLSGGIFGMLRDSAPVVGGLGIVIY